MKSLLLATALLIGVAAPAVASAPTYDRGVSVQALFTTLFSVDVPSIEERCASDPAGGFAPRYAQEPELAQRTCIMQERLAERRTNAILGPLSQIAPAKIALCMRESLAFGVDEADLYRHLNRCLYWG